MHKLSRDYLSLLITFIAPKYICNDFMSSAFNFYYFPNGTTRTINLGQLQWEWFRNQVAEN